MARQTGLMPDRMDLGRIPPEVENFKIPEATSLIDGLKPVQRFVARHLTMRPVADEAHSNEGHPGTAVMTLPPRKKA